MPTTTQLTYGLPDPAPAARTLVVIGRRGRLQSADVRALVPVPDATWDAMIERASPGDWGASASTYIGDVKVVAGVLPEVCGRNSPASRSWAIPGLAKAAGGSKDAVVIVAVDDASMAVASVAAVSRAFPRYSRKSGTLRERSVFVSVQAPDGPVVDVRLQPVIDGVRQAGRLVDMPTSELNCSAFVEEARLLAEANPGVRLTVLQGQAALAEAGLGGIWGVGKAANDPPALVAMEYTPPNPERTVAWVGKGVVYDTGGLSLKGKAHMPGMKGDMGGAAAVIGAFQAAVATGVPYKLIAVLCLAENAVGPDSVRPDDILRMHSGKTVEVNNTDAEGRLCLADGVSWVARAHSPDLIIDLATLTGAALVTSGKVHAAIYTPDADVEAAAVAAGQVSGNPVFPLLYAPELLRKEFKSHVADMKNSVKDRANAQSSCAAMFVESHLPKDAPAWLHVDLAGPAWDGQNRGTGFGVPLLLALGTAGV
jgi:probable aminopeptidase NPEPL1